jgi:osmotically-inducible protein OsmY
MLSNSPLQLKILDKLRENGITDAFIIEVKANEVSIKGTVKSYKIKDKIEQLIIQIADVTFVNNELAVFNEN